VTQDASTGALSFGTPYGRRTPWYTQTDFNFMHSFKVNKNNERQILDFQATIANLFNQRAVVSYWQTFASYQHPSGGYPYGNCGPGGTPGYCTIAGGAAFYQAAETGYDLNKAVLRRPFVLNSGYGMPNLWQQTRNIRLAVKFTF
jgi:hypothetical protein